jgi:hypothetical protein
MMKLAIGTTGWFFDFGKWAWGLGAGAISGGAGVLILSPLIASIDPQHFTTNIFQPGPHTLRMMELIFAYGAGKNMLSYMATNQIPTPFRETHSTELEETKMGLKLTEETHKETMLPTDDKKK